MITIDASNLYYPALNRRIRETLAKGQHDILLTNVLGQRYIGSGLSHNARIHIYGIPGQDLAAFMNGPTLEVFGNAQDGLGNTMNAGTVIVHGKAGEIPGHSMRGGNIFIKGDVEYRAGIHMKEYHDQVPLLVIGGTAKDYCGEYMAGGRIIVLNLDNRDRAVGESVATGIHGGALYVRGTVAPHQLGKGAIIADIDPDDRSFLETTLRRFSEALRVDLSAIAATDFVKIVKKGHRPFANLYTPAMNIKTGQPRHINMMPPCAHRCPSSIPTPVFLNLIRAGKVREAQLLMDEYTPFRMSVCGTVCPAPCMNSCSRGSIDRPLAIPEIAREYYPDFDPIASSVKRKQKIAIIGAGPAGLSAAWQLARRGFAVTVYDRSPDLGGKLRMAIPRERLSDEILDRDINRIKSLGIAFRMGMPVDRPLFEAMHRENDAVIVATGAYTSRRIAYSGGERIRSGLEFLMNINDGRPMDIAGKSVLIIGAGNVGMDIACEAWRLGAKKVTAIDIQKPLAFGKELAMAQQLGTDILWPRRIARLDDNRVYFDDESAIDADLVLFSIGEKPNTEFLPESVLVTEQGYIRTGDQSFRSSDSKVYACGDITRPGLVTDAVGQGRLAAMQVHADFDGNRFFYPGTTAVPKNRINAAYFGSEEREIDRCISCGICVFCDKCVEACPQKALSRNGETFTIDPARCTGCYTCVNICPRGALQTADFAEFLRDGVENEG